jgi:hypothetical protein
VAYTEEADLVRAAGGAAALAELADINRDGNATTIAAAKVAAQARADSWIDFHAWRLHGGNLPFSPVPVFIRELAAEETIYRLKVRRRVQSEVDDRLHEERAAELEAMKAGTANATADPYPLGAGGGTPIAVERSSATAYDGILSRDSLKGFS